MGLPAQQEKKKGGRRRQKLPAVLFSIVEHANIEVKELSVTGSQHRIS